MRRALLSIKSLAAWTSCGLIFSTAVPSTFPSPAHAGGGSEGANARRNGFVLTPAVIPIDAILSGGPARDGIPALDAPATVPVADAPWRDDERVIGVALGGQARAYPLAVLVWHELVNDTVGGRPVLVSYCPLCGTGLVFDRELEGRVHRFGVSGLLYRSDLLMFDRETESLWSQIAARAVTGPLAGERLSLIRTRIETWGQWKKRHPETRILSAETGHDRPYGRSPYGDYARSSELNFPLERSPGEGDGSRHPKMPTLGLRLPDGTARAYPADEVQAAGGVAVEHVAGRDVSVRYDLATGTFDVDAPNDVEVIEAYWFAWSAFHPNTTVFEAEPGGVRSGGSLEPGVEIVR